MEKEQIRQKALFILNNLGEVEDSDYPLNYSGRFSVWCKYKIQGLLIESLNLKYADNSRDIKKSMKDILIKYDGNVVYDSKTGDYMPGFWEELFETLYTKVPAIIEKRRARRELLAKGDIFFQNTLANVDANIKIGKDIVIKNEVHDQMDWNDEAWRQRSVYYKDELVLQAFSSGKYDPMYVVEYVPGEWESEVLAFSQRYEEQKRESHKLLEKKRLDYIRNL